jgi:hypothetical protein
MPLAADFHRGLPPRQDPELEAREHRNRFTGGTSGGEVSPNISKVSSAHLHCATTSLRNVPMAKAAFIAKSATQDEQPTRYSIRASSTKLDAGCQPSLSQARLRSPTPLIITLAPSKREGDGKTNAAGRAVTMALRVLRGHVSSKGTAKKAAGANCCIAMPQRRGGKMNPNRSMLLKDRFNRPIGI